MSTPANVYSAQLGDVLWYQTGNYTATRVCVVAINGVGATRSYMVKALDRCEANWTGHFRVSYKKCYEYTEQHIFSAICEAS